MLHRIDLQALAERKGPERSFLSLYVSAKDALNKLDGRIRRVRDMLDDADEAEHFDKNLELIQTYLDENPFASASMCLFACWATDYLHVFPLDVEVPDLLWVDSSPYIRPLAELKDELETFVVVTADNTDTHIYTVTSAEPSEEERVKGDIKNHVRKGGWSQQRYARRREKELLHYAKEVAEVLADIEKKGRFDRLFLVGSDEAMREIEAVLPNAVLNKLVGKRAVDLHQEDEVWERVFEMFTKEERAAERSLWETIKNEYLRGGQAVTGVKATLEAAAVGRARKMIVTRDAKIAGTRCRDCENLSEGATPACPVCNSDSVFTVDLVNELVELVAGSGGETEFSDHIRGLTKAGHVAALLRY